MFSFTKLLIVIDKNVKMMYYSFVLLIFVGLIPPFAV